MNNVVFMLLLGTSILIIGIIVVVTVIRLNKGGNQGNKKTKTDDIVLKQARKRLAQNPRDTEALSTVADLCFKKEDWEQAFQAYELLDEIASSQAYRHLDKFEIQVRYGLSALQLGKEEEAFKGFNAAWEIRQDNLIVNYNMGYLEYQRKNYEKAIPFLFLARKIDGEHAPTLRYLGLALFKLNKYKEAQGFVQRAVELVPSDKDSLYVLAECYYHQGQIDQALKIFTHLRSVPGVGAKASLFSGIINMDQHKVHLAIEDFEIGLKHEHIEPDVLIELQYQLAKAYLNQNEIAKALSLFEAIKKAVENYKDVDVMIEQYRELNDNHNLQTFMLAASADFIALCRKIVMCYYLKSKTKIINVVVNRNDAVDITAEVETSKWTDIVAFRFIRTENSIGELVVRDFHSHLKEVKAGRGICLTVGTFSEEAVKFTEARLIDLIEKKELVKVLARCE